MNWIDFTEGVKPKKNINTKKGMSDNPRLINDDIRDEMGKINVGTLIDFRTPELAITEVKIWLAVVLKKFQNTNPESAYSG